MAGKEKIMGMKLFPLENQLKFFVKRLTCAMPKLMMAMMIIIFLHHHHCLEEKKRVHKLLLNNMHA